MSPEREVEERIAWLERAVLSLSGLPGVRLPPRPGSSDAPDGEATQEVLALIDAGKDLAAINAHRNATGKGLREAKAEVERIKLLRGSR